MASLRLSLTPDQVKCLDEASEIEMGFQHDLYDIEHVRNIVYGGMHNRILA